MTRALTVVLEAVLDIATLALLVFIVSEHRWLDIALWISTAVVFVFAVWIRTRRRSFGSSIK